MNKYTIEGKLANEFLELLEKHPEGLTFYQIWEELPITGQYRIMSDQNQNLVLWANLSLLFCQIFSAFRKLNFIYFKACGWRDYQAALNLPIADVQYMETYSDPHWLPTKVFSDLSKIQDNEMIDGVIFDESS